MKRIISLGLAALILLGTLTGGLISAVYAEESLKGGDDTGADTGTGDVPPSEGNNTSGKPSILTNEGILIEKYYYLTEENKNGVDQTYLVLVLVDTNIKAGSSDSFNDFYFSLLTSNFYPLSSKNNNKNDKNQIKIGESIATTAEVLSGKGPSAGDKNLRFQVKVPYVGWDRLGNEIYFRMYYDYNSEPIAMEGYEIRANLSQFVPPEPSGPSNDPVEPDPTIPDPATPYILVQNYSYGEGDVAAGSDFALTVNFYNTSANINLENIIMKVEPTNGLSITGASNTYYIPNLGAKGSMTKSIPLKCLTSATPGSESVHITFSYEYVANDTRNTKSSEETISIPIAQTERFEVSLTEFPTMLYPGDNTNAVISYVNKGRADIYNLTATIAGNIDDPNQIQNLGNIKAGDSGSAKFSIASMEAGGQVSCVITITYENEKGDLSTITKEFTCEVYDNSGDFIDPGLDPGMDPGMMPPEEEAGMRWWQWTLFSAGSLSVGGVSGLWMFLKTKMKREEADDEDI